MGVWYLNTLGSVQAFLFSTLALYLVVLVEVVVVVVVVTVNNELYLHDLFTDIAKANCNKTKLYVHMYIK